MSSTKPEKLLTLTAFSHDASHFSLIPREVATPTNLEEMQSLISSHNQNGTPITFRSGGTSLSGQASTHGVLVDSRRSFKRVEILENGKRVKVEPGATIREINNLLKSDGFKMGPDPASEVACTVGGVIANNSSGMICGTTENAYRTIESMKIVFADGTLFDTAWDGADTILQETQPRIYQTIVEVRDFIQANPDVKLKIESLFSLKNTMGYGMNSFIDFNTISEILLHLIIGSEGTLVYIAEATFRTVPIKPALATSLLLFDSLKEANNALSRILGTGPAAIELLDSQSLKVSQRENPEVEELKRLRIDQETALLVEYQEANTIELNQRLDEARDFLGPDFHYTQELKSRNDLWHLRKGLYATVAGARREGTTALLEDIAVPVAAMTETCESLTELFNQYQYEDSVIFGHVKDGNIHFMINEDFSKSDGLIRYERFTESMVELVLDKNGTLKAEHGTGRAMAPFVERQYGPEIYRLMVKIKKAFDPQGIFNPGVIISSDARIHLKNIKINPQINSVLDKCVECGFCESICPSRDLTLTPRQRIIALRAVDGANRAESRELKKALQYGVVDTCAVDGLCQRQCPVGINTGGIVKDLRTQSASPIQRAIWSFAAKRWPLFLSLARTGITFASLLPSLRGVKVERGRKRFAQISSTPQVIYLPSCINEFFGPSNQDLFQELCTKAGVAVLIPEGISGICCGTPWKSKGVASSFTHLLASNSELISSAEQLHLPIVTDNPSCTEGFTSIFKSSKVYDSADFISQFLLNNLDIEQIDQVIIHPTCSSQKLDGNIALMKIAHKLAKEVTVPPNWGCCGFAGDRGLIRPELTRSATALEAEYVRALNAKTHISNNRTCEMAMTAAVGSKYENVILLLNRLSRSRNEQVEQGLA